MAMTPAQVAHIMSPSDDQCDAIVARVMDEVAKAKGLDHAMHLNADISTQSTLRRAIVRAAVEAALRDAPQAEPKRCPYCDDTGDVHSIDGQWRGTCKCPAGRPQQAEGWVMVPKAFLSGFHTLAHNWSLEAIPPDYMWGTEGDVFKSTYRQCGHELAKLKDLLAACPSAPTAVDPDELMKFARRWEMLAYMHTRGVTFHVYEHYIGNPDRLDYAATLHREYLSGELARAALSATTPESKP